MTVEDALESVRQGVDAIWISNHGTLKSIHPGQPSL